MLQPCAWPSLCGCALGVLSGALSTGRRHLVSGLYLSDDFGNPRLCESSHWRPVVLPLHKQTIASATIIAISLRTPDLISARRPASRTSVAYACSTPANGVPRSIATDL